MVKKFQNVPSVAAKTANAKFGVIELATTLVGEELVTVRSVPQYLIKVAADTPYDPDEETIQLFATTPDGTAAKVYLDVKTPLTFVDSNNETVPAFTVKVAEAIELTTTHTSASPATVKLYSGGNTTLPEIAEVVNTHQAAHDGLIFVHGLTVATPTPSKNPVDTSDAGSGVGVEQTNVEQSYTFESRLIIKYGDRGGQVVRTICYDPSYYDREFYARLTYTDGETHEGFCKITNVSPEADLKNIRALGFTAQIQGETYEYTAAVL